MSDPIRQLDAKYLQDMADGDNEFIAELLGTYVETAQDLIEAIQAAAREGTADKALYAAHTLKGSSRSIGAEPLGELCQALEQAARRGDMEEYAELSHEVPARFQLLKNEIEEVFDQAA